MFSKLGVYEKNGHEPADLFGTIFDLISIMALYFLVWSASDFYNNLRQYIDKPDLWILKALATNL